MNRLFPVLALMVTVFPLDAEEAASPQANPTTAKADKPIVVVYDLEGRLSESGNTEPSLLDLSMSPSRPLTLFDLSRSLEKAAADGKVKAVVLDADQAQMDFAQVQEIRRRLAAVRAAGKDVWLYTEALNNATALLGSVANHFTLMPEADCSFHGVISESIYFKGLLDKAGVIAEVIHIGDFKSFGEMFYRDGPSDEARQQQESLIDSVFQQVVTDVAASRKLDKSVVLALIDDATLRPSNMLDKGMADHLMHRTDFVRKVRETYGKDAKYDSSYELPDLEGPEITGMMDLLKLAFSSVGDRRAMKADYLAVVALDGDISDESVAPVRSQILKLAKDDKARGLILRVNSPGGSALASDVLWEATEEWKATGKPFVVSMGGVAASGGYYVSSAAERIFAEAGTITGSIGVVGMKLNLAGAMEKLGITSHSISRGANAGMMSMTRGFTETEANAVRKTMEDVYRTFKHRVTDGRGKALKGDLEPMAGGRVFSGSQALELGLVDEIGGLAEAVAHIAKAIGSKDPDVRLLPEPKSGFEGLFAKPEKDEELIRASATSSAAATQIHSSLGRSGFLSVLPDPLRSVTARLLSRVEAFAESRVLLLGPEIRIH